MDSGEDMLDGEVSRRSVTVDQLVHAQERRRRRDRAAAVLLPAMVAAVGIGYWQAKTSGGDSRSILIPSFTSFASEVFALLHNSAFWAAAWTSERAILYGYVLAVVTAVPFGLILGQLKRLDALSAGWLDIAVVTPTALFMPMVLIIFGPSFSARVCVVFIFAFPFIVLPCRTGSLVASRALMAMAQSFGANRRQIWRDVLWPSAFPSIIEGLRQGLAHAFTGMFLVELIYLTVGIGKLLQGFGASFDTASTFGVCFLIVGEATLLMALLQRFRDWRIA